jgi:seryl-tRNA synthetase
MSLINEFHANVNFGELSNVNFGELHEDDLLEIANSLREALENTLGREQKLKEEIGDLRFRETSRKGEVHKLKEASVPKEILFAERGGHAEQIKKLEARKDKENSELQSKLTSAEDYLSEQVNVGWCEYYEDYCCRDDDHFNEIN